MPGLIDIHCHILSGLDDGPKEMAESVAMGQMYAAMGFTAVVATPHCIPGTRWMPEISLIRARARMVRAALEEEGVVLKIYTGMEIALDPLVPILLRQKRLLTLANGPYLLIESPFQQFPLGWEGILAEIRRLGYKILLAHPERCAGVAEKPSLVDDIQASGVYVQVNLDSLAGLNGRHVQKAALLFADRRCLHCLATDSHDSLRRCPAMVQRTAEAVAAVMSRENLRLLMKDNPERVLHGHDLKAVVMDQAAVPVKTRRRKWFGLKSVRSRQ